MATHDTGGASASPEFTEGQSTICNALIRCACGCAVDSEKLLIDAFGDLIDVPLTWANVDATMERLRGAVHSLTTCLQEASHVSR